jgi:HD-GYP domain-containing protein (c-di-GMP phosphodiesterase class II)
MTPRAAITATPLSRADPLESFRAIARRVDGMASWSVGHSQRVSSIARALAAACRWASADLQKIERTAELHDVGKLCVSEEILTTSRLLDAAARAEVEMHPSLGGNMLATVLDADEVGWVRHHHERWDGSGYPDGLRHDEIPAGAAIIALAEAWDAMRSSGPVRPRALSVESARAECRAGAGTQFAPWAVRALDDAIAAVELVAFRR